MAVDDIPLDIEELTPKEIGKLVPPGTCYIFKK
jgi:hypothetical protein